LKLTLRQKKSSGKMESSKRQILFHIIGCIAFLSLPVIFSPDFSTSSFRFIKAPPFQRSFLTSVLLLLFFYFNYFWLLPNLYFKKRYLYFFISIILCYAFIRMVPSFIIPQNTSSLRPPPNGFNREAPPPGPPQSVSWYFDFVRLNQPLFQFVMILVLSIMIRINNRLKISEKEKINAELSYLKAQINPHFLFNTLNSIYASAIQENADSTASAIVKLSGMMRYVISEAHHEFVSLEKEMNYISDYVELQKIRLGNTIQLNYEFIGGVSGKKIAPLILISFIENAFKHGINPEENSSINIRIETNKEELKMDITNKKVNMVQHDELKNGIGIENTKYRLQLLYPSKHQLQIEETEKDFSVHLKISLE
jgi:Histidine kinase